MPGILYRAEHPFGMRHHDGKAPVRRGQAGDPLRRTVRVERIGFSRIAAMIDIAHCDQFLRRLEAFAVAEIGIAFAVRHHDRHAAARHVPEENRRRGLHFDHHEARLELLGTVAREMRPVFRARNDLVQVAHHLATVAYAQREGVPALEESFELVSSARIEQYGFRPAFACPQHVPVGEPAARRDALEVAQ